MTIFRETKTLLSIYHIKICINLACIQSSRFPCKLPFLFCFDDASVLKYVLSFQITHKNINAIWNFLLLLLCVCIRKCWRFLDLCFYLSLLAAIRCETNRVICKLSHSPLLLLWEPTYDWCILNFYLCNSVGCDMTSQHIIRIS